MEGLRVVFARERLDRLGLECVAAEIDDLAEAEEFVERHCAASRVRNMPVFCSSNTCSPRWLTSSLRMATKPSHGRDFEVRALMHCASCRQRVAGQHRLLPFRIVDAGRALRGRIEQEAVADQPHEHRAGVPARGRQPAEDAGLAGRLVEMHRLCVELAGEFDDLFGRHDLRAERGTSRPRRNPHTPISWPSFTASCSSLNFERTMAVGRRFAATFLGQLARRGQHCRRHCCGGSLHKARNI